MWQQRSTHYRITTQWDNTDYDPVQERTSVHTTHQYDKSEDYSFKYTNKMQRYTIFFITVNVLHVSDGFSAHHQEFNTVHTASSICQACLLAAKASGSSKQA